MIKSIRNIFLTLCIIFACISSSKSQSIDVEYITWTNSGVGYWTKSTYYNIYNDFDWAVTRTQYPDYNGYYTFKVWLYSQSYYWDGRNATYTSTNIRNIDVYLDGTRWVSNYSQIGITFKDEYVGIKFKIKKANPYFMIKWGTMSAK